jgi:hypothetical protein
MKGKLEFSPSGDQKVQSAANVLITDLTEASESVEQDDDSQLIAILEIPTM